MRPVYGTSGSVVAVVDSSGAVTLGDGPGPVIGAVRGNEIFGDEAGARLVGHVDSDGRVYDADHEIVGRVEASMLVADKYQSRAGRVFEAVDAGVLLLLVAEQDREPSRTAPPADADPTVMDELLATDAKVIRIPTRPRRDPF
ncbi:MAG TPA: hypothetical protein VID19_06100 [Candidatus Eremiobacteraceae bacterium]